MNIYAIGDLHLSFSTDKPMDIFGPNWERHYEKLNNAWRKLVKPEDYVIICGDISWGLTLEEAKADLDWIRELPGTKIITKGNHDLWWQSISKMRKLYADEEGNPDPKLVFIQNDSYVIYDEEAQKRIVICGTRGWTCPGDSEFSDHDRLIYEREAMRLEMSLKSAKMCEGDKLVVALHYPPTNDKKQASEFTRLLAEYGVDLCIYGHLHGKDNFKRGLTSVFNGVEYKLVSFDYLMAEPALIY